MTHANNSTMWQLIFELFTVTSWIVCVIETLTRSVGMQWSRWGKVSCVKRNHSVRYSTEERELRMRGKRVPQTLVTHCGLPLFTLVFENNLTDVIGAQSLIKAKPNIPIHYFD